MSMVPDSEQLSEQLRQTDALRRQAMISADIDALDRLLGDDLVWTHSSGVTETKTEFIDAISAGAVNYEALEVQDDHVRVEGSIVVHHGVLRGAASRDGQTKFLQARFLSVWRLLEGRFELIAWQSTNAAA